MRKFVSVKNLADRYEVNKSTIWRWAQSGQLPAPYKLASKCTRWNLDEIEQRDRDRIDAIDQRDIPARRDA